jgi:sulfide:quinone oxidoreductase
MAGARIVILGGGFGGAAVAQALRGSLADDHRITLIDRNDTTHLCGMNPLLAVGARDPAQTTRSLDRLAAEGIQFAQAHIEGIDTDRREVGTSTGTFPYDFLVVALGADYDWEAVPGSEQAHSFYDFDRTLALRDRLADFDGGRIVIGAAGVPYKCPPAPFEMAMILDWDLRRRSLRDATDLHVFIPEPAPVGIAGPEASGKVRDTLASRGIGLHTSTSIVSVSDGKASFSTGEEVDADLIVTIPRHRVPRVITDAGLARAGGWVRVEAATLETDIEGVFAIGDVNTIPIGEGKAVPKAGVFAAGEGRTVAAEIAARIGGATEPEPYDGAGECFLAYSGTEAALVGGRFLAPGGPEVALQDASQDGMAAKERFEEDWRRFAI